MQKAAAEFCTNIRSLRRKNTRVRVRVREMALLAWPPLEAARFQGRYRVSTSGGFF
jgi:hypothetical protein